MTRDSLALFGCPRSGTSWLGQLFNHHEAVAYRYQPLFAYEFKDWFGRHGVSAASVAAFHAALREAHSDFVLQPLRPAKAAEPEVLVWKEVRFHRLMGPLLDTGALGHVAYLYRDPVDVLNSWYQAPKEFRAGQDIHAEWRDAPSKNTDDSEFNGFSRWKQSMALALALADAHPGRVSLVRYERLRAAPRETMRALLATVGLAPTAQVEGFIADSTSRDDDDAYGVFRTGTAPLALPPTIVEAIRADEAARDLLARADARALEPTRA
jgi:hypothetical protein